VSFDLPSEITTLSKLGDNVKIVAFAKRITVADDVRVVKRSQ
jgi:hypothetical protein